MSSINFGLVENLEFAIAAKQIAEPEAIQTEFTAKKAKMLAPKLTALSGEVEAQPCQESANFNFRNFAAATSCKIDRLVSDSNQGNGTVLLMNIAPECG